MSISELSLKQLSTEDGVDIYNMLQRIKANENEFKNSAYGITYEMFKDWLIEQNNWSYGLNLPSEYVPQTIYWLYKDNKPVGIGKIRHFLNDHSRMIGGNIGYAIDPQFRGKGYATVLLGLLIQKAHDLGINEILLTVEKSNPSSRRVIEKNGGRLIKENTFRWFFVFE